MQFLPTDGVSAAQPRTELQRRSDDTPGGRHAAYAAADDPPRIEWGPVADIHETNAELTVTVELPGISPHDVHVTAEDGVVTIDGARSPGHLGKRDGSYHLRERHNGPFVRRFRLPSGVDASAIRSEYADGLLTVHVPKAGRVARVARVDCAVTTAPDGGARAEGGAEPARADSSGTLGA